MRAPPLSTYEHSTWKKRAVHYGLALLIGIFGVKPNIEYKAPKPEDSYKQELVNSIKDISKTKDEDKTVVIGNREFSLNNIEDLETLYQEQTKRDPENKDGKNDAIAYLIIDHYSLRGYRDKTLELFKEFVDKYPNSKYVDAAASSMKHKPFIMNYDGSRSYIERSKPKVKPKLPPEDSLKMA